MLDDHSGLIYLIFQEMARILSDIMFALRLYINSATIYIAPFYFLASYRSD